MLSGLGKKLGSFLFDIATSRKIRILLIIVPLVFLFLNGLSLFFFPDLTISMYGQLVGAENDFNVDHIQEREGILVYDGEWGGSVGIGLEAGGDIDAKLNPETQRFTAVITGNVGPGSVDGEIEGTINEAGVIQGKGAVNGLTGPNVHIDYTGQTNENLTRARGSWETTTNLDGGGYWELNLVEEISE